MVDEKKSVSPGTTNDKTVKKTIQPTPSVISIAQKNISKPDTKGIKYKNASKRSIGQIINDTIPKEAIPTKRIGYIFGFVLLIVVIIGIFQFPFGKMLSGTVDVQFEIGMPWHFFVMDLSEPESLPIKPGGLFADMLIYLLIAYLIDVIINVILNTALFESKEEKKRHPGHYKGINRNLIGNQTLADRATQKVFERDAQKTPSRKEPIVPTIVGNESLAVNPVKTTTEMLPPKKSETPQIEVKNEVEKKELVTKPLPPKRIEKVKEKEVRLKGELKKEGNWYIRK